MLPVEAKDVSVLVYVESIAEYQAVGCATSIDFTYENEIIPKTDANAGLFRKKRVRISDFSGSVQGLVTLYNNENKVGAFYFLQEAIRRTEQLMKFLFTDASGVIREITGLFLVQSEQLSGGAEGDFAEFDLQLEGTGDLTLSDVTSPADADCFEAFSDYWDLTPGASTFSGTGTGGKTFAGQEIIEVVRENGVPLKPTVPLNSGTPGDREYSFDGTTITTWVSNPYSAGERAFVIWQQVV
jgi:hypothetical protein